MAKVGRPLKTTADFKDGWQDEMLSLFAEGASRLEVYTTVLEIDDETFARMVNDDEQFSAIVKRGLQLSETWWQSKGRKNVDNKDFNSTLWYMNMKNRFGWKDRQDVTTNDKDLPAPILPVGD